MAHPEQANFFKRLSAAFPDRIEMATKVVEIGSQDINGSVRNVFQAATTYVGVDLGIARGVDWTVPGELLELPDGRADMVITTECLEHCSTWQQVFNNALRMTMPGGMIVMTCASTGRAAHGTIDSSEAESPFTTSYYRNLVASDILDETELAKYCNHFCFETNMESGDLYFWGIRNRHAFTECESHWLSMEQRLARAQGQLAQAASRHAELVRQLEVAENICRAMQDELASIQIHSKAPNKPTLIRRIYRRLRRLACPEQATV